MDQLQQLTQALNYLDKVCDGAYKRDVTGFNGADSGFGKWLSFQARTVGLDNHRQIQAVNLLQKYRGQIESAGLELPTIDEYQVTGDSGESISVKITVEDGQIAIRFGKDNPAFKQLLDKARGLSKRRFDWDLKAWLCPMSIAGEIVAAFPEADIDEAIKSVPVESKPKCEVVISREKLLV